MVALVLPNYLFPTPASYPYGVSQAPVEGSPTPASHSPSPSLPPLPSSPPHRPDSPLFNSRCSSPLQLNLLQLEESPRNEGAAAAGGPGSSAGPLPPSEEAAEPEARLVEVTESSNQDALSGSSDLLELLLQEDSRSGTGSAASGSLGSGLGSGSGSGSHEGGSTSASLTRSSQSSHTSKYFGSVDSSEAEAGAAQARAEPGDQVIKYVLQDPIWLLMANADQHVMMTYQVPPRDAASVLKQDRERLRAMQKQQPRFSEDQRRELGAVHSWVRKGQLPRALDVMVRAVWDARKRLRRKMLNSRPRDRELKSDLSVFGPLALKDANSISLLLGYTILDDIASQVFTELPWPIILAYSRASVEHFL